MHKIIKTKILSYKRESIIKASNLLNDNELVAFPTETVYGLGGSAVSNAAVAKIFAAKSRPKYNPLIVHIANKQEVHDWAFVPKQAQILIDSFWPGPLTLVLNQKDANSSLASLVTGNLGTIAIRLPMHATARALIKEFGFPIAAPSANISGRVSPTRAKDVLSNLDGRISALIKGGNCSIGVESTIVSFANEKPVLLRPGGIPANIISEKMGEVLVNVTELLLNENKILAPGMMESHYSPACKLKLNETNPKSGQLFLGFGNMPKNTLGLNLSPNGILKEAAANLFASLTDIDTMASLMKIKTVHVSPIPNYDLGITINDRLKRAAAPKS